MPRMFSPRATWKVLRGGNLPARLRATREGQTAVRPHVVGAALDSGVLDALAGRAAGTAELARSTGVTDVPLLGAFLRVAAGTGLIRGGGDGPWQLTASGRTVVEDDLVRASYEAFADFHTGLYRDLRRQLRGGPPRRDVVERGEVIARISAAFEPFVDDVLRRTVTERRPRRVVDVGCGAGLQLATMLEAAPGARGVGIETDAGAADLAERTLERRGLAGRASVLRADVRRAVDADDGGLLAEPFDVALLANVVYYVPLAERVELFRALARLLAPGGVLLVVTTAATRQLFSRHFDLLLRAQEGAMELPDADALVAQLAAAGLHPGPPRRIAPGLPLVAVAAPAGGRS